MSDQYATTNQSNSLSGLREISQAGPAAQIRPVQNDRNGAGPALLVMLVFIVVAILASSLSNFNTGSSVDGNGDAADGESFGTTSTN